MISVDEALEAVLKAVAARGEFPAEEVPLADAAGRVLRERVVADRDMPPFTRSAMDGYALRAADTISPPVTLAVIEEIPAGVTPRLEIARGEASKIMTGGALPAGADAVQMIERTRPGASGQVVILESVDPGTHVRVAGEDLRRGAPLLEEGRLIDAVCVALLAGAGRIAPRVSRRPRVEILPTGDELVPVDAVPAGACIRESNGHTLRALVSAAGGEGALHPIVPDRIDALEAAIRRALGRCDVLLLSGGVSMGDYDLVGKALDNSGCTATFDRVAIQPGKPLWFGTGPGGGPLVFGLPGNPVSTLVDFVLFVRPALRGMAGCRARDRYIQAPLAEEVRRRAGRRGFLPGRIEATPHGPAVHMVSTRGSADMVAISKADVLVVLSESRDAFAAGEPVPLLPLEGMLF